MFREFNEASFSPLSYFWSLDDAVMLSFLTSIFLVTLLVRYISVPNQEEDSK